MSRQIIKWMVAVPLIGLMSGCQIIGFGVATIVGAVGLVGYSVYKTGDAVVTGVGKAGKATGSVLFFNGDFTTECDGDVSAVWSAASRASQKADFWGIKGSYDALSGELTAKTRENTDIRIQVKSTQVNKTELRIRIGVTGDMKLSETLYGLILAELGAGKPVSPSATNAVSEVKK